MRRTLLLLATFAALSLRTTLAGDAPPDRPPDSLRFTVPEWSLVKIDDAAIDALVPSWKGKPLALLEEGVHRDMPSEGARIPPFASRHWMSGRAVNYEIRPEDPGERGYRVRSSSRFGGDGDTIVDDDKTAVERFAWWNDNEFGSVAAAEPAVYDGRVPRWFLAHVPRGKSASLPIALPGPGPVHDATVTIKVWIYATHAGPVSLSGRWANTDLGEQTAPTAAGGATLTFTCLGMDVPPPNGPLTFTDRTKDLPATTPDDVSEGRGMIWIDGVVLEATMLPSRGPRVEEGDRTRIRLSTPDVAPLLTRHWDSPDPVAAARGADMVVLSTAPLLAGSKRLAEHRSQGGVRTQVIAFADVLDRWGHRGSDPSGCIGAYLAALAKDGKGPTYVLLCGDAALDRTDIVDWESIPTMYARTKYNGATASDRMFALPNPEAKTGGPAIGRLPFRDPKDLDAYVDRVIRYETAPPADPTRRLLRFVTSEGRFGAQADALIERMFTQIVSTQIPPAYDVEVTFASVASPFCWPPPLFNERVLSSLNEGALFYTYVGHGYAQGFDHLQEGDQRYPILRSADAPRVDVTGTPPALFVVACTTAIYDLPKQDGVGEALLKRPNGPIAYWGATRICHPVWNGMVGRELASRLFQDPSRRLGEVIAAAVDGVLVPNPRDGIRGVIENMMRTMVPPGTDMERLYVEGSRMYELLGDPAIRIAYPSADLAIAVERSEKGVTLRVTGALPDGAEVRASLEVSRDRMVDLPKFEKSPADPAGHASMKARHARANDKAVARGSARAAGGAATLTLEIPEAHRGATLVAKAWTVAGGDVHQGSSPVPAR